MHQVTYHWDLFLETVSLYRRSTRGTGGIHHTCHAGGFRWRVIGVCMEAVGRLVLVGVWTGGPEPVPVCVSLWCLLRAGTPSQVLEPFFPLTPWDLGLQPCLDCCHWGCLRLPGLAGLVVGALAPAPRCHFLFLNLRGWEERPWSYLSCFSHKRAATRLPSASCHWGAWA